jgi:hypothetical protein
VTRIECLPPGTAEKVRLLISEEFGGFWDGFQGYICEPCPYGHEWRFSGRLGFGGKLHLTHDRLYVSCYPEDSTPGREAAIARVNESLAGVAASVAASEREQA